MNIKDIADTRTHELFQAIIEYGGVIHGGCLRDLIANKPYNDIDVYYSRLLEGYPTEVKYADDRVHIFLQHLAKTIKTRDSWHDMDYEWADQPLDHYGGEFNSCYMLINADEDTETAINLLFHDDLSFQEEFLDFDINSLYLLPDGTISSYLGADAVNSIVKNIRNNKCRLLRSDVSDDRIDHILEKGFRCDLLVFR